LSFFFLFPHTFLPLDSKALVPSRRPALHSLGWRIELSCSKPRKECLGRVDAFPLPLFWYCLHMCFLPQPLSPFLFRCKKRYELHLIPRIVGETTSISPLPVTFQMRRSCPSSPPTSYSPDVDFSLSPKGVPSPPFSNCFCVVRF